MSLLALACLTACSKEDALTAEEDHTISYFLPKDGDDPEEAQIRTKFYQEESSFLLFNDTIRHESLGVGADGKEYFKTEVVDLTYSVGDAYSYSDYFYTYEYLPTVAQKRLATTLLQDYILPHLGSKNLKPFSWLLVKSMSYSASGSVSAKTTAKGERCTAVAVGDISSETDMAALTSTIMQSMVGSLVTAEEEKLADFYAVCDGGYDQRADDEEALKQAGFLQWQVASWDETWVYTGWTPIKTQDASAFVALALGKTETEVNALYGNYALIMQKYNLIKQAIESIGYIF